MADGRRRGGSLAARFRAAVQGEERQRRKQEAKEQELQEQAQAARTALMADLVEFATEIGIVKVRQADGVLSLRHGERIVHFEPEGEHDVIRVRFEGVATEENRLYREAHLSNRWVWSRVRGRNEDRLPLFDTGLEELMVLGLDLPRPGQSREMPDSGDRKL